MKRFQWARTVSTIVVILITIIFLVKTLNNYYEPAKQAISSISFFKIIISSLFFLGHFYMRAISWKYLVNYFGEPIGKMDSLTVWFFSEFTRYIPGNIWSFASRTYLARKHISKKISLLILPTEVIAVISTATILSLYAIIKTAEKIQVDFLFYSFAIGSLLATFMLLMFHKVIRILVKKVLVQNIVFQVLPTALALQLLSWCLYGAGYLILIGDVLTTQNPTLLFSSTLLAWLVGYITIISPMGIGVREGTFILLIGSQIGTLQATVIAILARVILIITELINLIFWVVMKKYYQKISNKNKWKK